MILKLTSTIEHRDPETYTHCVRVSDYAIAIGSVVGLGDDELDTLYSASVLHDLGKVAIPDAILRKRGPLSGEEERMMRLHPVIGERLCGLSRSLDPVRPLIRSHHERLDGGGYPDRLRGDRIPVGAQILSIADAFDAMVTDRPYQAAFSTEAAVNELRASVRRGWRRGDLVSAFVTLVEHSENRLHGSDAVRVNRLDRWALSTRAA